ncbi:transcriptional regulator, TetR family [Desulfuromusa kysingii]|uniref:Transcriptional regulator, TetR family n=1 Tax=Desulfuromusa kysingii TaxID=37625 RepID=A0A1H4DST4_9BACT|nr:TetR/AcrR family transcriptional regulator [Desulfuromusa kysingii]SEA75242.1 transcriptional regulator, TetR family [Desulfuromusa kysingii]
MKVNAKHLPADERKKIIVATVIELAGEQDPNTITTAAIAKRMGLTQGALFRHFANKSAIFEAVMEWVEELLVGQVEAQFQVGLSPHAVLRAVFMTHVDFVSEFPGVPRILFAELQRPEETGSKLVVQRLLHRYRACLQQLFEEGKERQDFDIKLDTEAATILFIGTLQGLVVQSLLAGEIKRIKQNASKVFAIYQRGITNA